MARELYRAAGLPVLQNRTFATAQQARACGAADVLLVQDEVSGLVFNQVFDPSKLVYDADYQNEQAHSPHFQRHLEAVEGILARHFRGASLVEVGCGKGYFLQMLRERGYAVKGVDPSYEGQSDDVVCAPFTRELGIQADGVILRHVLEHIQDPCAFLGEIAEANEGGLIYIEVPCFDWIIERCAWFDVFYEHVNYFRLDDFTRMFGRVVESGHLFGGQYLYVVADLASLRAPRQAFAPLSLPTAFKAGADIAARALLAQPERRVALWGASSKGVIYSLFLLRAGVPIDCVVDINPDKQGRFLPLSGQLVSSPEQLLQTLPAGALILVMNSNYLDEIRHMTGGRYTYLAVDGVTAS
ncbi:class I SAM-dependent methyltransferase [Pseudomonas sp. NY15463]|uniref:class I SAM-dependent methyltransferase n=1 Tax=Pseudomonas sp. NY15463 TaxID=3400361 RepID=UPI003A895345